MPRSGASPHSAAGHTKIEDLLRRTVKKPEKPKHSREQLCDLCEKVVQTEIITNEDTTCIPPHGSLKKIMPNSLHERCLFLADMIGNMKERLAHDLGKRMCLHGLLRWWLLLSHKHKPWLMNLVETLVKVQRSRKFCKYLIFSFILYQ